MSKSDYKYESKVKIGIKGFGQYYYVFRESDNLYGCLRETPVQGCCCAKKVFKSEFKQLAKVEHPNVSRVLDFFFEDSTFFAVFDINLTIATLYEFFDLNFIKDPPPPPVPEEEEDHPDLDDKFQEGKYPPPQLFPELATTTPNPVITKVYLQQIKTGDKKNPNDTKKKKAPKKVVKVKKVHPRIVPEEVLLYLIQEISAALSALHDKSVYHRILNPHCILYDGKIDPFIFEAGFSKQYKDQLTSDAFREYHNYLAPEIWDKKKGKAPADIWSLGVIMYFLASKRLPFEASSTEELKRKIKNEEPLPIPAHYSKTLRQLILGMLDKNPKKRITTRGILESLNVEKVELEGRQPGEIEEKPIPKPKIIHYQRLYVREVKDQNNVVDISEYREALEPFSVWVFVSENFNIERCGGAYDPDSTAFIYLPTSIIFLCQTIVKENSTLKKLVFISPIECLLDFCFFRFLALETVQLSRTMRDIRKFCFAFCQNLQNILFPPSLEQLGFACFLKCQSLASVSLPNQCLTIHPFCFSNCVSLETANLPRSLSLLPCGCFFKCSSLKQIRLNPLLRVISLGCFALCANLESISIPRTVDKILPIPFKGCAKLFEVEENSEAKITFEPGSKFNLEYLQQLMVCELDDTQLDNLFMETCGFSNHTSTTRDPAAIANSILAVKNHTSQSLGLEDMFRAVDIPQVCVFKEYLKLLMNSNQQLMSAACL